MYKEQQKYPQEIRGYSQTEDTPQARISKAGLVLEALTGINEHIVRIENLVSDICGNFPETEAPKPTPQEPTNIAYIIDKIPESAKVFTCRLERIEKRLREALI